MRTTRLSIIALAGIAIVLVTAAVGHAAMANGRLHSAPGFAARVASPRFEVRHVDSHDGRFDSHHFDNRHFHHRFHDGVTVSPYYYWPYYPYTYYAPAPNYYWYCPSYGAYYPSVQSCPDEWVPVPTS